MIADRGEVQGGPRSRLDYPVHVINLQQDADRLTQIVAAYREQEVELERYSAINGSELAAPTRYMLYRDWRKGRSGVLGCALSHLGVWLEIASGPADHALVIEDDGLPMRWLPSSFAEMSFPPDYDLCWVNDRMVPPGFQTAEPGGQFLTLAESFLRREAGYREIGCYGYFVSRAGAEKMIRLFHRDHVLGHVDQQLVAYGHAPEQITYLADALNRRDGFIHMNRHRARSDRLNAYVMVPALIRHGEGPSARSAQNRVAESAVRV